MTTRREVPRWYLSLNFLTSKVHEKGFIECFHDLLELMQSKLIRHLWSIPNNIRNNTNKQPYVLYAFYDLAVSPTSFDIVAFLVLAELEREKVGCSSLHVVIVPGYDGGFRKGALDAYNKTGTWKYDYDYLHWRLRNMLVPCCWLIPSCHQVTVCTSREEAMMLETSLVKHVFPKKGNSTIHHPQENYLYSHIIAAISHGFVLPSIHPKSSACRHVSDWIKTNAGNRKVITITLRECSYEQDRNSNLKEWSAFARNLDPAVYFPVIIRDTESALGPLPPELNGLTIFAEVPWNVELRAALYELSYLNMSASNGPAYLFIFNHLTRYLLFNMIVSSCDVTSEKHFDYIGIKAGSQLKHATPFQRLIWEDDKIEVLQREFKDMCDKIESFSEENITEASPTIDVSKSIPCNNTHPQ